MPSFVCIANTVAKLQARRLRRNRHRPIVAWSAKLLSSNAEIDSRLNFFSTVANLVVIKQCLQNVSGSRHLTTSFEHVMHINEYSRPMPKLETIEYTQTSTDRDQIWTTGRGLEAHRF